MPVSAVVAHTGRSGQCLTERPVRSLLHTNDTGMNGPGSRSWSPGPGTITQTRTAPPSVGPRLPVQISCASLCSSIQTHTKETFQLSLETTILLRLRCPFIFLVSFSWSFMESASLLESLVAEKTHRLSEVQRLP